eukprot:TRINITY_DN3903_c0_g3_i1.p1 TRINITY_DN3903_c0_g3~~TRINITY_DN3903_c0_g3_i1.p1  ORF type:complete len:950 (+),score=251.01 TRINITY_DN3903_c0_g3_i1:84-2933(+)
MAATKTVVLARLPAKEKERFYEFLLSHGVDFTPEGDGYVGTLRVEPQTVKHEKDYWTPEDDFATQSAVRGGGDRRRRSVSMPLSKSLRATVRQQPQGAAGAGGNEPRTRGLTGAAASGASRAWAEERPHAAFGEAARKAQEKETARRKRPQGAVGGVNKQPSVSDDVHQPARTRLAKVFPKFASLALAEFETSAVKAMPRNQILRIAEEIYEARSMQQLAFEKAMALAYDADGGATEGDLAVRSPQRFPDFCIEQLHKCYGLRSLIGPACWGLMAGTQVHRKDNVEVEILFRFLTETYDHATDLVFFLSARQALEKHGRPPQKQDAQFKAPLLRGREMLGHLTLDARQCIAIVRTLTQGSSYATLRNDIFNRLDEIMADAGERCRLNADRFLFVVMESYHKLRQGPDSPLPQGGTVPLGSPDSPMVESPEADEVQWLEDSALEAALKDRRVLSGGAALENLRESLEKAFALIDADRSGILEASELAAAGFNQSLLERLDTDGDGSVSKEEFVEELMAMARAAPGGKAAELRKEVLSLVAGVLRQRSEARASPGAASSKMGSKTSVRFEQDAIAKLERGLPPDALARVSALADQLLAKLETIDRNTTTSRLEVYQWLLKTALPSRSRSGRSQRAAGSRRASHASGAARGNADYQTSVEEVRNAVRRLGGRPERPPARGGRPPGKRGTAEPAGQSEAAERRRLLALPAREFEVHLERNVQCLLVAASAELAGIVAAERAAADGSDDGEGGSIHAALIEEFTPVADCMMEALVTNDFALWSEQLGPPSAGVTEKVRQDHFELLHRDFLQGVSGVVSAKVVDRICQAVVTTPDFRALLQSRAAALAASALEDQHRSKQMRSASEAGYSQQTEEDSQDAVAFQAHEVDSDMGHRQDEDDLSDEYEDEEEEEESEDSEGLSDFGWNEANPGAMRQIKREARKSVQEIFASAAPAR